jgi:hypothetical protein
LDGLSTSFATQWGGFRRDLCAIERWESLSKGF